MTAFFWTRFGSFGLDACFSFVASLWLDRSWPRLSWLTTVQTSCISFSCCSFQWDWKLLASSSLIDVAGSAPPLRQDSLFNHYFCEQSITWLLPLSDRPSCYRFLVSMFKVLSGGMKGAVRPRLRTVRGTSSHSRGCYRFFLVLS